MNIQEGFKLLEEYEIPVAEYRLGKNKEEVIEHAEEIGYPVAVKIDSPDILHKTDKGCVAFGIEDEKELVEEWRKIKKNAGEAKIEGFIIQENLKGKEVIIGGKHDPQFGETVLFGLGGIFVEIFEDVALRVTPFNKKEAENMIKEIKGYPLLTGARGETPVNVKAVVKAIMSAQKLMIENPVKELDINPLFAGPKKITAADVRVIKEK